MNKPIKNQVGNTCVMTSFANLFNDENLLVGVKNQHLSEIEERDEFKYLSNRHWGIDLAMMPIFKSICEPCGHGELITISRMLHKGVLQVNMNKSVGNTIIPFFMALNYPEGLHRIWGFYKSINEIHILNTRLDEMKIRGESNFHSGKDVMEFGLIYDCKKRTTFVSDTDFFKHLI